MTMKKYLPIIMVALCIKASAASTTDLDLADSTKVEYCETYLDYLQGSWNVSPYPCVKKKWRVRFLGEDGVRFISPDEDKKKDSFFRKKPRFVKYDNLLYLNCLGVSCGGRTLGAGYLPLYPCGDDGFIIIMNRINRGALYVPMFFLGGGAGCAALGIATKTTHAFDNEYDKRRCYYYNPLNNTATMLTESYLWNIIGDDEKLANELLKIEGRHRDNPATVVYFLHRLGLIDRIPVEVTMPDNYQEEEK